MRTKKFQPTPVKRYWSLADHFRKTRMSWLPTAAGYEMSQTVQLEGRPWKVCMTILVFVKRGSDGYSVEFKSSVTLWPPTMNGREEAKLQRQRFYARLRKLITSWGYSGTWSRSPYGKFADFWKTLPTANDVHREATRLERALARSSKWATVPPDSH
jgi:hypothetical protein